MPVIRIGDLTTYAGDTSGSWLVLNDPTNTTTYKAQREQLLSGNFAGTASYALTASYVDAANIVGLNLSQIASGSATASISPGLFNVNTNTNIGGDVTASNALFTGTITAQRLVTQVITSSTEWITGSTRFGSLMTDTHQFTGSVSITGSLLATASWANQANTASYVLQAVSSSFAITASYALNAIASASNALTKTGSAVELGGFMYKNTFVTGTLENSVDLSFTPSGSSFLSQSANGTVYGIDKDSLERIYVVGTFTTYKGTASQGIARLLKDGTIDTSFNVGTGFSPLVIAGQYNGVTSVKIDQSTGKVYVAGVAFSQYSGSSVGSIVRLNTDGTLDTSFNSSVGFTGATAGYTSPFVSSIDLDSNGKVLCSGVWTSYSGSSVTCGVARLNSDGTYDSAFNVGTGPLAAGVNTVIHKIKVEPGTNKVYISGQFNSYSGSSGYNGIVKLNPDGTIDNTFNAKPGFGPPAGSYGYVGYRGSGILIDSNLNVYFNGYFTSFNTTGSNCIIKVNSSGSIVTSFNYGSGLLPNTSGLQSSLYLDQYSRLYYYGSSTQYSGSVISGSTRILQNGTIDPNFNTRFSIGSTFTYNYVASNDNKSLYLIGIYNSGILGGTSDNRLVKVNIADPELQFRKTLLSYDRDYSQFFTTRSLVDKGYVDNITASYALSASWAVNAVTASYVPASGVVGLNLNSISSGSVTASVNINSASFQLTSGSSTLLFVSNSGFVGIGRDFTSPTNPLDVSGSTRVRGVITGSVASGAITVGSDVANTPAINISGYFNAAGAVSISNSNARGFNLILNSQQLAGYYATLNGVSWQSSTQDVGYFRGTSTINITDAGAGNKLSGFLFDPTITAHVSTSLYAFRSTVSSSANRWNLYVEGSAPNYFAGQVGIGTVSPSQSLDVSGSARITQNLTASRAFISSSNGTASGSTLIVFGSGSAQPVFTVQGSQGELFSVNDSLSGSLFSVNDISGLPIIEAFSDNRILIGSYQAPALFTTVRTTSTQGSNIVYQNLPTASYDGAFFDYTLRSGSNARAGQITAIWSGSSVNYTETVTTDFGDTTGVRFAVIVTGSNMALTGSFPSASWTMKTIVRSI